MTCKTHLRASARAQQCGRSRPAPASADDRRAAEEPTDDPLLAARACYAGAYSAWVRARANVERGPRRRARPGSARSRPSPRSRPISSISDLTTHARRRTPA